MTDHCEVSRKNVSRYDVVIGERTYEPTETACQRAARPGCCVLVHAPHEQMAVDAERCQSP
jgi:hypothetical protein